MSLLDKISKNKKIKDYIYNQESEGEQEFISTGCITLNILFSGRVDGGIPIGKMSQIAAPSQSGKSFIGLKVALSAQKKGLDVIYIDSEFAYDPEFAESVGLDKDKLIVLQDNEIETVQTSILNIFQELDKEEKKNILLIIDSYGGFVTSKTTNDALDGKDVLDMTIAKKKNSFARLLTGLGTTIFVVNHVYDSFNQYDPISIGGGRGLYFASSSIVLGSSKAKSKDGTDITGAVITAKTHKGRFCKENSKLKFLIKYEGGIHPYYGILDDALEGGYIEKPTMGFYSRPCVPEDKKWREKALWDNAKEFWTPVFRDTDFKLYIEKKYTFKHSEIVNDELEF